MNSFIDRELLRNTDYDLKAIILTIFLILIIELLFMFGMAIIITCVQVMLALVGGFL